MKFDNDFNEVKIRHVIIIYLITISILIAVSFIMLLNFHQEINSFDMNVLSLLAAILLYVMLMYKIKPSKDSMKSLYKDFKNKLNIKEVTWIILFFSCLNIGATKLVLDIIYLTSPSLANVFINDYCLTINSKTDYFICFAVLVILSPIIDELTFRNVLFKRLTKKFDIYIGIIVSSIIFSAINICPEIIGTLVLGIINCILYVKYENILIPMFIYFINNFFYMLASIPFGQLINKVIYFNLNDIVINAILGIVLFTVGIISMVKFIIENRVYLRENSIK